MPNPVRRSRQLSLFSLAIEVTEGQAGVARWSEEQLEALRSFANLDGFSTGATGGKWRDRFGKD